MEPLVDVDRKVLLIDDDPDFGSLFVQVAENIGINAIWADSLSSLGKVSLLGGFDVLLIDYRLNEMTGREIAEYVDALFEDIPVILISADCRNLSLDRTLPSCVKKFLLKSVGIERLVANVALFLRMSSTKA